MVLYIRQAFSVFSLRAIPHPTSLRSATFPNGEGKGASN